MNIEKVREGLKGYMEMVHGDSSPEIQHEARRSFMAGAMAPMVPVVELCIQRGYAEASVELSKLSLEVVELAGEVMRENV